MFVRVVDKVRGWVGGSQFRVGGAKAPKVVRVAKSASKVGRGLRGEGLWNREIRPRHGVPCRSTFKYDR